MKTTDNQSRGIGKFVALSLDMHRISLVVYVIVALFGCQPKQGIIQSEALRLDRSEIEICVRQADAGDAEAAKKLWHHYGFAEHDEEKGDYWKKRYDALSEGNAR